MNDFGILERRAKLEAEIREAKKSLVNQKRIDRELKKVASGGRVSPFLKRESDKSQTLAASVNLARASDSFQLGQAIIQYQSAINESKRDPLKAEIPKSCEDRGVPIPPPPSGQKIYVLAAQNGELYWMETQDCD